MSWANSEAVTVLTFLLPGFVAAAVFYSLTSHPKPSPFERVIQALLFTLVIQAILGAALLVGNWLGANPLWPKGYETSVGLVASVAVAAVVALIWVFLSNHDTLHHWLRKLRVTNETSYPSEWYTVFAENPNQYVVLHLTGQRRLYGFPHNWPSDPNKGHFAISEAVWLTGSPDEPEISSHLVLIPAADVEMVQFTTRQPRQNQEN